MVRWIGIALALALAGCSVVPISTAPTPAVAPPAKPPPAATISVTGNEVAFYAVDLIGTGYRFGGKHPSAGLDCSGMVTYIYEQAAGLTIKGSAADIARRGREIERAALRPGDLVFFNTLNKPFSHVAIYIGDNRFIHAPSSNGKVRIDRLDNRYWAQRYQMARSYFD